MSDRARRALAEAKRLGFLGPAPVEDHLAHATSFIAAMPEEAGRTLDLGSGGGVPGLVLADEWPERQFWLLEGSERRAAFLRRIIAAEGFANCEVIEARAEMAARRAEYRGSFDVVVARSFGPPAVVAECGAPFLAVGGQLLVSEPPAGDARWPPEGLAILGLRLGDLRKLPSGRIQSIDQAEPCSDRFPRRVGVPARHPLF